LDLAIDATSLETGFEPELCGTGTNMSALLRHDPALAPGGFALEEQARNRGAHA
jgi:hypothetical protein